MPTTETPAVLETSFLAEAMHEAAAEVFSTMLNNAAKQDPPVIRQSIEVLNDGVVSLIGLTGEWVGSGVLSCSSDCARWMSSQFLMSDYEAVNDEVLDAIEPWTLDHHARLRLGAGVFSSPHPARLR